jgi:F-type H+-transporting ATPase subunit b
MIEFIPLTTKAVFLAASTAAHAASDSNPVSKLAGNFHVEWSTLTAQLVSFLLIIAALRFLMWKPLLKTLDERRAKIADGLQYAEEMKSKLADAERQQAETIKEAAMEAKRITVEAQQTAKAFIERTQAESQRKAEELVAQTRDALTQERKQMLAEVKEHATHLVALTTARVLQKELGDADRKRFIEAASRELVN